MMNEFAGVDREQIQRVQKNQHFSKISIVSSKEDDYQTRSQCDTICNTSMMGTIFPNKTEQVGIILFISLVKQTDKARGDMHSNIE
jgi:hypothetical protein